MLEKLLTLKHWQLFIIVFGLPLVGQIIFMSTMFESILSNKPPQPQMMLTFMPIMLVIGLVVVFILMGWFYAIVTKLDHRIPADLKINMKRFKIFFFFPIFYIVLIIIVAISVVIYISEGNTQPPVFLIAITLLIIVPSHLFALFCMGHTFYCVGKTIKLIELKKQVKFEDFVGEFFLAWFYIIGFWILQPRINKIWAEDKNEPFLRSDDDVLI